MLATKDEPVEIIPKFLNKKFGFLRKFSVLQFILLFFGLSISLSLISVSIGENGSQFIFPFFSLIIPTLFSAYIAVRHYSKEVWIPSSPFWVQLTSQNWFNSVISIASYIRHWFELLFINGLIIFAFVTFIFGSFQLFGS